MLLTELEVRTGGYSTSRRRGPYAREKRTRQVPSSQD